VLLVNSDFVGELILGQAGVLARSLKALLEAGWRVRTSRSL